MSMISNQDLIRRIPLFSLLDATQSDLIARSVVKRRFKRGELLIRQGTKSNALFILLTGRTRVFATDPRGREVILARLGPGDYMGEMSLIDGQPHSASVRAEVQTDVLMLARAEFERCMPEPNSVAFAMLKVLARRLRHADQKIESLALMDVYGRVAHALLEMAQIEPDGSRVIRTKVSRQDLAKTVGASREMVSRVMRGLETRGFIQLQDDDSLLVREHLTDF